MLVNITFKIVKFLYSLPNRIYVKVLNMYIKQSFPNIKGYIERPNQLKGLEYITIGNGTYMGKGGILTAWDNYAEEKWAPKIVIGKNCSIGEFAHISACNSIEIGDNLLTGRYVYISDNAHGNSSIEEIENPPAKRKLHVKGPVIIDDNVWIGERVCILSGVHIGKGAIIAANAIVTHDVPANTIAGGVPAKIVKKII